MPSGAQEKKSKHHYNSLEDLLHEVRKGFTRRSRRLLLRELFCDKARNVAGRSTVMTLLQSPHPHGIVSATRFVKQEVLKVWNQIVAAHRHNEDLFVGAGYESVREPAMCKAVLKWVEDTRGPIVGWHPHEVDVDSDADFSASSPVRGVGRQFEMDHESMDSERFLAFYRTKLPGKVGRSTVGSGRYQKPSCSCWRCNYALPETVDIRRGRRHPSRLRHKAIHSLDRYGADRSETGGFYGTSPFSWLDMLD